MATMNENTKRILSTLTYEAQESNGIDDITERVAIAIDGLNINHDAFREAIRHAVRKQAEMDHADRYEDPAVEAHKPGGIRETLHEMLG